MRRFVILGTLLFITCFNVIGSITQDNKATKATDSKTISLNQQEKQPFIDILNRFDAATTKKQLAEREMEIEQLKLKIAVDEIKKLKGCDGCQFDLQKLELVKPEPVVESKKEVKP